MRVERVRLASPERAPELAERIRALVPGGAGVAEPVSAILEDVRRRGDAAVLEYTRRFDTHGSEPPPLKVAWGDLARALAELDPEVRAGLALARENVERVARAGVDAEAEIALPQGQRVRLREIPVRRAAVYVPGGRAPYPSSVVMGAATARAAGVADVVVAAPPGAHGEVHRAILAAAALCGVREVLRVGGAQAIAALAHGTETVERVDVIVGPGNLWVQEAKRQVSGLVGIDGFAGPSDLVVVAATGARADWVVLDLLAQAEHGTDTLVATISADESLLDAVAHGIDQGRPQRATVAGAPCVLVDAPDAAAALALAEALAPEHLELVGVEAEALAPRVRAAGCLFVGGGAATAFGDYVAGSNHVLPTGGAARFASGLSPRHFRRRMAEVRLPDDLHELARHGAAIARAEGFDVHAESMEARMGENPSP